MARRSPCKSCGDDCGNGTSGYNGPDEVMQELCRILCMIETEVCEGRLNKADRDRTAKERANRSSRLNRRINNKYGRGSAPEFGKRRIVPYRNAPKSWGRTPMTREAVNRHLKPVREALEQRVKKMLASKLAKKAATAWMKFVPGLNVLSTAYDIYDLAKTGHDIYKEIDNALSAYDGDVYRIKPDVAVNGPDGSLNDIYDFKFSGDDWNPGQKELYDEALKDSIDPDTNQPREAKSVNPKDCACDYKLGSGTSVPTG